MDMGVRTKHARCLAHIYMAERRVHARMERIRARDDREVRGVGQMHAGMRASAVLAS